jgi:hypothetical protein
MSSSGICPHLTQYVHKPRQIPRKLLHCARPCNQPSALISPPQKIHDYTYINKYLCVCVCAETYVRSDEGPDKERVEQQQRETPWPCTTTTLLLLNPPKKKKKTPRGHGRVRASRETENEETHNNNNNQKKGRKIGTGRKLTP